MVGNNPASDRASVRLEGRAARLRLVQPSDYAVLRDLELGSPLALRWRLGGQHIPVEQYGAHLWDNCLAAYIFESRHTNGSAGVVMAYGADLRNGFTYLAFARLKAGTSSLHDAVVAAEALVLFLDFLFQGWNFRKIYIEVAEYNLAQFASLVSLLDVEARLTEHVFLDGRHWDLIIAALRRENWPALRARLARGS